MIHNKLFRFVLVRKSFRIRLDIDPDVADNRQCTCTACARDSSDFEALSYLRSADQDDEAEFADYS